MSRANPAQMQRARRLLAHEGVAGSANERATTAACRVYDKIYAHMAPLVGDAGVQLLFARSAKLAQGEFAGLAEISILEGSTQLRERLQERDPPLAPQSAAALFGTFMGRKHMDGAEGHRPHPARRSRQGPRDETLSPLIG